MRAELLELVAALAKALEKAERAICADAHWLSWFDDCPYHIETRALLERARAAAQEERRG